MGRIVKGLFVIGLAAFAGLTGYAYLGDLAPRQAEITQPVILNAD